ncbi:MAG: 30S ribosome-binding factor RbfA [Wenzhouxiangellaceae bacterium]|nr:30S ribosome-binding factor RbfA [Wenzhouxiangellaceae bacterium]
MNNRSDRVAGLLRREIADILRSDIQPELPSLISLTDVEVSRDLAYARVFVSVLEIEKAPEVMKELAAANAAIRHELARRVHLRIVPSLKFLHDTSSESGQRIEQLLAAARKPKA